LPQIHDPPASTSKCRNYRCNSETKGFYRSPVPWKKGTFLGRERKGNKTIAVIAEVLDPKGLRKRMNRQDTNREDQKADDQLANFNFCIRLISSTTQEVLQSRKNFYAWETMPWLQPPWFHKQNPDLPSLT
jgi:hypothetical protein